MTVLKAFRLPVALTDKLKKVAKLTHRSETYYVQEALNHFLDDYYEAQIAKDRFTASNASFINGGELRKRLGL